MEIDSCPNPHALTLQLTVTPFTMESSYLYTTAVYSVVVFLLAISFIILFKLIRPYFNIQVTCWFCQEISCVPYGNRNCWDCVHCDQYNGFTQEGDYNKAIPSQYEEDLNYPINCTQQSGSRSTGTSPSKLCERCERNQLLKVRQLANFTPATESRFDEEVEAYERKLERAYRLCFNCEHRVTAELHRQNAILRPRIIKYRQSNKLYGKTSQEVANEQQSQRGVYSELFPRCLFVVLLLAMIIDLLYGFHSLPLPYRIERITPVFNTYHTHRDSVLLAGLISQLLSLLINLAIHRRLHSDLALCILWLASYGHEVLKTHSLLPDVLSNVYVTLTLSTVMLIVHCGIASRKEISVVGGRPPSPASSCNDWNSMVSDSGISLGNMNTDRGDGNIPTAYSNGLSTGHEAMDCAVSELSSLSLGNSPYHISPPAYDPLLRPAQFDTNSVHSRMAGGGGSVHSFHSTTPIQHNYIVEPRLSSLSRSPSRSSMYAPSQAAVDCVSNYGGRMACEMPVSPSVSNYRSVGSAPGSPTSTIYSNGSYLPMRVAPEKTALLTQIFLGISLGVNISVAAFIMGRYSVNGDLLTFV